MTNFIDVFGKEITFSKGLLGLEEYIKYKIEKIEGNDNFYLLQSCNDSNLAMIVINPFQFVEDYEISLDDNLIKTLDIQKEEDVVIFNTVTLAKEEKDFTTNLVAPIIINIKKTF